MIQPENLFAIRVEIIHDAVHPRKFRHLCARWPGGADTGQPWWPCAAAAAQLTPVGPRCRTRSSCSEKDRLPLRPPRLFEGAKVGAHAVKATHGGMRLLQLDRNERWPLTERTKKGPGADVGADWRGPPDGQLRIVGRGGPPTCPSDWLWMPAMGTPLSASAGRDSELEHRLSGFHPGTR